MNVRSEGDFPAVFGKALRDFLQKKGIRQSDAAKKLGISRSRMNTYCRPDKPAKPEAQVLYLLCVEMGFTLEYKDYKISAKTLEDVPVPQPVDAPVQLSLEFDRQFRLTNDGGEISITVKRPAGRVEVSLTLDAAVS